MKFSPILSMSGSSLAISSISGRALASLSVDAKGNRSIGEDGKVGSLFMMHNCAAMIQIKDPLQGRQGQVLAH